MLVGSNTLFNASAPLSCISSFSRLPNPASLVVLGSPDPARSRDRRSPFFGLRCETRNAHEATAYGERGRPSVSHSGGLVRPAPTATDTHPTSRPKQQQAPQPSCRSPILVLCAGLPTPHDHARPKVLSGDTNLDPHRTCTDPHSLSVPSCYRFLTPFPRFFFWLRLLFSFGPLQARIRQLRSDQSTLTFFT